MKVLFSVIPFLLIPLSALMLYWEISTVMIGQILLLASGVLFLLGIAQKRYQGLFVPVIISLIAISLVFGYLDGLLYYPAAASIFVASCFILSYWAPVSLVEKIAKSIKPELPSEALSYCRKVNHSWSLVLLINALITIYAISLDSVHFWAIYNGAISYLLIATVFVVEFFIRQGVKKRIRLKLQSSTQYS